MKFFRNLKYILVFHVIEEKLLATFLRELDSERSMTTNGNIF